jgi:predicted homoserine dehydrogenase-like protein
MECLKRQPRCDATKQECLAMPVSTIGIVGAGVMGSGIAQVAATKGLNVVLVDVSEVAVRNGNRSHRRPARPAGRKRQDDTGAKGDCARTHQGNDVLRRPQTGPGGASSSLPLF